MFIYVFLVELFATNKTNELVTMTLLGLPYVVDFLSGLTTFSFCLSLLEFYEKEEEIKQL